jgi:DNA helicase-2/ATP-dependent DNA helicase PcrA
VTSSVEDILRRELEHTHGDIGPAALVAQASDQLPEDVDAEEARSIAVRLVDGESAVADGGSSRSNPGESGPETPPQPGDVADSTPERDDLSTAAVRDHYRRVAPALEALATLDGSPTIGLNDYYGWYVKRDTDNVELLEDGFDQVGRVATLDRDLETILDRVERSLYAVTTYKDEAVTRTERPCTYDRDDEATAWKDGEDPMPGYGDVRAVPAWGDIDLRDAIKPERGNLDEDTRDTIERTLEAYISEFATLYGGREAVYALDSVGGAYIFGAPEATLPVAGHFEDADARARVMEAFIERSNDWLREAQRRVNARVDGAADVIDPDWVNNKNRQYKAPLSLHTDHDAVVTPLDTVDLRYEYTPLEAVDEDLVTETVEWSEAFTAVEHTDRVATLVGQLWPEYTEDYDDWRAALEAWVEDEREAEREAERRRREAKQRRAERMEQLGGDLEGQPITPFLQDIYDAVDAIDTADVVKRHAADQWDTGRSTSDITEFDPSWRTSDSGSSCYVDEGENTFGDPGQGGGGYAAKAIALGEGILSDASADLEGSDWWDAVDALRNAGYEVPVYTPEAGSKRRDGGEYDEMPLWAVRQAAVALEVCPPDAFIEREGDDGGTYLGFPGGVTYNNALEAIEDAGLDHGREYADTGPTYPVYDILEAQDIELHLIPINGSEVRLAIEQNGQREYSETQERGFWTSGTKRGRIAGRVSDALTGVDQDTLSQGVKDAINQASVDAEENEAEFEEQMRSEREQVLRDRTVDVVCYPAADSAEWVVTLEPPSESPVTEKREITFSEGDFNDANAGAFRNAHLAKFYTKTELDKGEWFNLVDYWLDIQDTREPDPDHELEAAVDKFIDWVTTMKVWADEEGFTWNDRNGFYAEDYDGDTDAILVPGQKVVDWQRREDVGDVNLSRALREKGVLLRPARRETIAGQQRRAWPVNVEDTPHSLESAHRTENDDSDDGDDEDGGTGSADDSDSPDKPDGLRTDGGRLMTDGGQPRERAHVTKLFGAPGSGKTTKLLQFAEREAEEYDTQPGDLLFLTFTKSARKDAFRRITGVYPDTDEEDLNKRVKTLHGAALSSCLIEDVLELRNRNDLDSEGQLIIRKTNDEDARYFAWFFRKHFPHIEYDTDERDPIEELREGEPVDVAIGNRIMALYDYVKSNDWPLDQYHRAPFDVDLAPPEILDVLEAWEAFKERNDLMQDDDYVKAALEAGCAPPGSVLLIDEFQDLSPLQYDLYEMWRDSAGVERVYIAGDVHQAIYGFRGADPTHLRETPADETIHHEESKRCPEAVVDAAVPVVEPPAEHDVSRVTAWRDGGRVDHLEAPDADALSYLVRESVDEYGEVFLLTRTNRQAAKLAWGLRQGGVPYLDLKPNGPLRRWDHPAPALLAALRSFDEDDSLPVPVAEILLRNATDAPARREPKRLAERDRLSGTDPAYGRQVLADEYTDWFPNADTGRELVGELTVEDWRRELIAGALESDATHAPGDVRIGTIHAAKGLEAPCVLVFPAYTHRQLERFQDGAGAEERRLYYVAMTRASNAALVVHDYFGGEEFPPLAEDGAPIREAA